MVTDKAKAAEKQEDWVAAAESGDAPRMKLLTQSEGEWPPSDRIPQAVACKAAAKNQEGTLKVLLDWGVSLSATDKGGQLLLHCAAGAGAVDVVRLLIKRKVDVSAADGHGRNALGPALRGQHLAVVKELLRAGAVMPSGQSELPLGVHAVMKEVQLENQLRVIKGFQTEDKTLPHKLEEADKQVWKFQRAHMQLLERQEDIKVAKVVQDFDERIRVAEVEALEASKIEAALSKELSELKVLVQTEQMKQNKVVAEIQQTQKEQDTGASEVQALAKHIAEEQAELDKISALLQTEQEALARAEAERDRYVAECNTLNEDIQTAKMNRQEAQFELLETKKELEGLRKDRRRIGELQAEALEVHKTVGDDDEVK